MDGFPGGNPDLAQLKSSMSAVEQACASMMVVFSDHPQWVTIAASCPVALSWKWFHTNPAEAEKVIVSLRQSPMPYTTCRFILENSKTRHAKFEAAGAIADAAIREWGILTHENRGSLMSYCLGYAMEHSRDADSYVQSKVSAVAAQLIKRGWQDLPQQSKIAVFSEVKQAVLGLYGVDAQLASISFLGSLVSEFSPSSSTAMGLPAEFHEQCQSSLELNYLKEFYCWARTSARTFSVKIIDHTATPSEVKVCSEALQLMYQILNWNFKHSDDAVNPSGKKALASSCGLRPDTALLKNFDLSLVQPGPSWRDVLISNEHTTWILSFYAALRLKYSADVIWFDDPLAGSARQLIVQLCTVSGSIFPSDDGDTQIRHLQQILAVTLAWIDPPESILKGIMSGCSESEMIDGCHALLSIATLTKTVLFDNLLRSLRPFGTLHLLSTVTCEVVKFHADSDCDDEVWASEALDILWETWSVLLGRTDSGINAISAEGIAAAANLFNVVVTSQLTAAAKSAYDDDNQSDHFHASISRRDERLRSYSLLARAAADVTIPFLLQMFSDRTALLNQGTSTGDHICTLEEIYWLLLIIGHVLTDSGEGETILVPKALLGMLPVPDALNEVQHPIIVLSWSILDFARRSLDSQITAAFFSPRLMEAVVWFLARWSETYLMPLDSHKGQSGTLSHESELSRTALLRFAGENDQGKLALDTIVSISKMTLTSYHGENELLALTCQQLLVALTRRRAVCVHLVALDSWRELANAFANERTFFPLVGRLQRSLAQSLVSAACGMTDLEASNQYVMDLMGPMTAYLVDICTRNNFRAVAQQADQIYMVSCLLERLRGATRATQLRTQKPIFEMAHSAMNPLLTLLEIYQNQSAVVYLILKFVVDFVNGQVAFLNAKETSILVSFCLQLLHNYSSHNIGKTLLSRSSSLQSEAQSEKYKDLRALLKLLTNICSKDLVDLSPGSDDTDGPNIAEVVYVGLHIVTPLISLDILKYPKLSHDYFALVTHILEVYPEKVAHLNQETFAHIIGTLDHGIQSQDTDIVDACLKAVNALASYHYNERNTGKDGLGVKAVGTPGSDGAAANSIFSHFLRLLLQLLLFEDFKLELTGSAADALFSLLLCEQDLYQRLVRELLERQSNPAIKERLGKALHQLTSSNQISPILNRPNRQKFRKNLTVFLTEVSGYMRIK